MVTVSNTPHIHASSLIHEALPFGVYPESSTDIVIQALVRSPDAVSNDQKHRHSDLTQVDQREEDEYQRHNDVLFIPPSAMTVGDGAELVVCCNTKYMGSD